MVTIFQMKTYNLKKIRAVKKIENFYCQTFGLF